MQSWFDAEAWREVLTRTISEAGTSFVRLGLTLVGALAIVALGWLVSRAVEIGARSALRSLGADRASLRIGVSDALERSGLRMTLSELIARLLFWLVLLVFVLSAVETLGLQAVTTTLDRLIAFIPRVIGACLIVVFGLLFARFVSGLAASAFGAAGFANGARAGVLVQAGIATLVGLVAIEQIGVDTEILVAPLTVLVGAAAVSAGLGFALGARPIVTHILAGHFVRQSLPRDALVQIGERRGIVQRVGATETLLRDGDVQWSMPNAQILEETVVR